MNDLLVIAFPSEQKAEEVRQKLFELQKEYLIELGDAVVAVKEEDGKIKLNQMINTTAAGAVSGTFWGFWSERFRAPARWRGDWSRFRRARRRAVRFRHQRRFHAGSRGVGAAGGAALFLLVKKITTDKVLADLRGVAERFCDLLR